MTCEAPGLPTLLLAAGLVLGGCVEQDPGIEVTVEVALDPLPAAPIDTRDGPLPLTDARLHVQRVVFEPCPETMARAAPRPLDWLIGTAHAHGGADHAAGALTLTLDGVLTAGDTLEGALALPANHPICVIAVYFAADVGAELAVRSDGETHRWAFPLAPQARAIAPLTFDRQRRSARLRIHSAPARWLDPFTADAPSAGGGLAERLAAGVAGSLSVRID